MNAINYHNLLYLSEWLRQCSTESERQELLRTILQSSTHTWHHINLGGEHEFTDTESLETVFDLEALLNFPLFRTSNQVQSAK